MKYFNPPDPGEPPPPPDVEDLIRYLVSRVREAASLGGPIYPLLVVGDQGVGKSRLLSALAVELRRAGFRAWYDLDLPNGNYDYIILDDLGALITAWEWQTKAGRLLKKVEILIRNVGRWGYAVGAPRAMDVLKNFREKAKQLLLVSRSELRHEYGVETSCDVVAVYVKQMTMFDLQFATHTYVWPLRGRKYCIKWRDFRWYDDPEWRAEYDRVQSKREGLLQKWLGELGIATEVQDDPVTRVVRWIVSKSYEALREAGVGATDPTDAVAKALTQLGGKPYEDRIEVALDTVRLLSPLIHDIGETTLENFARVANEKLGREVAKVTRGRKGMRVEIALDDLIKLVGTLSPKRLAKSATAK
jgi:hypothetical protein